MKEKEKMDYATSQDLIALTAFASLQLERGSYLFKELGNFIIEQTERTNKKIMEKAIAEGKIDEVEIAELIKKYKVERKDIAEIFKFFYDKGISIESLKRKEESVYMITIKGSGIWKMRKYIKEKYGMIVMEADEAMKKMMEIDKENKNETINYIG